MKKLGLVALAGALALAPVMASAATHSSSGPPVAGGDQCHQNNPGQGYGQCLTLTTTSDISLTMKPACSKVTATDANFGNVFPTTANTITTTAPSSATAPLTVSWTCTDPTMRPIIAFQSPTNLCTLKNGTSTASSNTIPYRIVEDLTQGSSTFTLCNANTIDPPGYYYVVTSTEASSAQHKFWVVTGDLVSGGAALYSTGVYTDTVNVVLSF